MSYVLFAKNLSFLKLLKVQKRSEIISYSTNIFLDKVVLSRQVTNL